MVHKAVENTARLLKVARAKNVPVAKSYTAYGSRQDMPYWKVKPLVDDFIYGHPSTELNPLIHDPDFIKKLERGEIEMSGCEPCNECVAEMDKGGVRCPKVEA